MSEAISHMVNHFRERCLPEPAAPAGYAALIERYGLRLPLPPRLAATAQRRRPAFTPGWLLLTPRHAPRDALASQLEFALKWEGVDLSVLSALFAEAPDREIAAAVRAKPSGVYARRLWFLFEWLTGRTLDIDDSGKVRAVAAVDPSQQFALASGAHSSRHKVIDNLPGSPSFCPLARRTPVLNASATRGLDRLAGEVIGRTHADVVARAAAFLLLSDSRSSFHIEGERPSAQRAARWAQAIGEAGSAALSVAELERLQRLVIGDARFVRLGLRRTGGFVGSHDRDTGEPLPEHVSARAEDLCSLLDGLVTYARKAVSGGLDPVAAAAAVAFGFVYIHPFEDGNGRLHRWLIHHILAQAGYNPPGVTFPISAAILRNVDAYRSVLESFSRPLLPFIEWRATSSGNVEVLNDTARYYRYFDVSAHAEFLYACVAETVDRDLPDEVAFLQSYDGFSERVQAIADMPARTIGLLHRFLRQSGGTLSARARAKEFAGLTEDEAAAIETAYAESFAGSA